MPGLHATLSPSAAADDVPRYTAVHLRKVRRDGPARKHSCIECGGPALDWAYQHGSDKEIVGENGLRYSADLDDYRPMCRKCHCRMDAQENPEGAAARNAASKAYPSELRREAGLASVGTPAGDKQRRDRAIAGGAATKAIWARRKEGQA